MYNHGKGGGLEYWIVCIFIYGRGASVCLDDSDGLVCFSPQTGALQGDTSAYDMFLEVYHPCIDAWNSHALKIIVRDPITNFMVDVSIATYADDVSKILQFNDALDL